MVDQEGVALRSIQWCEVFPWLNLAKCFRLAISVRLLVFGAAAVLLTLVGWRGIAGMFAKDGEIQGSWASQFGNESAWEVIDGSVPNQPFAQAGHPDLKSLEVEVGKSSPMFKTWTMLNWPVRRVLTIDQTTLRDFIGSLFSALWSLAVWSFFGAAISRVAAVQLATGEYLGWGAALRWARSKWLAYFSAPVLPMLGAAIVVLPILLLGFLMKTDFLAALGGLIWPLVLAGGFAITLLVVGVVFGWPLMWGTISVEGTDSFDALNRTYSYVYQKPLRYFLYWVVAAIIGWLGWFVVVNFAAGVIWFSSWAASWGTGTVRMHELAAGTGVAAWLIGFWNGWVKLIAMGYSFSYFGVASTAIYYLLRRDIDARETDEVFLDAEASEQKFGLPKLQKDAAGAPEISENLPATSSPN
jgi:hypothetical protein